MNFPFELDGKKYALIGVIPIVYDYPLQNDYLKNGFALDTDIPDEIEMVFAPGENDVKNIYGY